MIILLAKIMLGAEIFSICVGPILMGKERTGTYDFIWWIMNLAQSVCVISLSLKVIGII